MSDPEYEAVTEAQLQALFPLRVWSRCYCAYDSRYEKRIAEQEATFSSEFIKDLGNLPAEKILAVFDEEFKAAWQRALERIVAK